MLQKLRERAQNEKGFTLIELLVVILIIGILAAIAIPAFLSQRSKGQDAAAKSIARTAQTAMESCATDNNGAYTNCDSNALKTIEPALNDSKFTGTGAGVTAKSSNSYTITTKSDSGASATITKNSDGSVVRSGSNGISTW